jgi:hypothetical protein
MTMTMSDDDIEPVGNEDDEWKEDSRPQRFLNREAHLHNPAKTANRLGLRRVHERFKEEKKIQKEIASVLSDMRDPRTPERLAANLRTLLASRGLTLQEAAKTIPCLVQSGRAGYRWFKRLVKDGLSQVSGRTKRRLEEIASFFGYTLEELRGGDISLLTEIDQSTPPPSEAMAIFGPMLTRLLGDGKHGYLRDVLDDFLPTEISSRISASSLPHDEEGGSPSPALARYLRRFYQMPDAMERNALCALVYLLHEKAYPTTHVAATDETG